ncbi:Tigger transposable element-derived protein 4 [Dictyocoela muelleri]|nr:Tigger transposable element-derived protein 4 [Dictyocoela muelleri]
MGKQVLLKKNCHHYFNTVLKSKLEEYEDSNVFNCDETGLMYKQANKRTYISKKDDIANGKFSKERVTTLFAVSKACEKPTPLLIAKSKSPRCFKNIKIDNLPLFMNTT